MDRQAYTISHLRACRQFAGVVADRIWTAWWRDNNYPLRFISEQIDEMLHTGGVPLTLVAHNGEAFLGNALVIESDMEARPQYTPWVAAIWVEPEYRKIGIGSALVSSAAQTAFALGSDTVYLCAAEDKSPFYEKLGWQMIEEDVSGLNVFSLKRPIAI
ncbi:GNAT family N-acetyltransferase [Pelagibacterium halotolerans]|uniref:GNAT family N-acetyltransferase n=1 Tax=Pelagibacterium halotolerans TaxID=531813 RepID=UPI00384C3741